MALIENIQREDLNPIEEATAYQRLVTEFDLRQEDIAAQVGKDRSSVANSLRLLKLPEEVRAEVASGRLSMGHARAIVALATEADQRRVARDVVARGLSVRETEALVKKIAAPAGHASAATAARTKDVHTRAAEEQLHLSLGTRVEIKRRGKGGVVEITFANEDELQRIYEHLTDTRREDQESGIRNQESGIRRSGDQDCQVTSVFSVALPRTLTTDGPRRPGDWCNSNRKERTDSVQCCGTYRTRLFS